MVKQFENARSALSARQDAVTGGEQEQVADATYDRRGEDKVRTLRYVLVTPARNEAAHIEGTIQSVVSQTVRPVKWVIVSDGSTDGTDEIVERYAARYEWIELERLPEKRQRSFAGKVHAFNAGLARLRDEQYDLIGNVDGDVSFGEDYFEYLLGKFAQNSMLGVAGTNYWEGRLRYDYRFTSIEDVAGACQLFRRECFESIGGYKPIARGGIDLVAVVSARMLGWGTRSFRGRYLVHHRPQGTAAANTWSRYFHDGEADYAFANHPLWEMFRVTYRMASRPFIVCGGLTFAGYLWASVKRDERLISDDVARFRRHEQMLRLKKLLRNGVSRDASPV
jgi:glycosyltransferase involved in cell wall biosynthesis